MKNHKIYFKFNMPHPLRYKEVICIHHDHSHLEVEFIHVRKMFTATCESEYVRPQVNPKTV